MNLIHAVINGVSLEFETLPGLFSPGGVDAGTLAMLSLAKLSNNDKVLDLGCGYGVVGIYAAKLIGEENVTMSDVDAKAVEMAAKNAALNGVGGIRTVVSNGFSNIDDKGYTVILSNPPYHEDFSVPKEFIEKGFNRLCIGGRMVMVTKRELWYKNKLTSIFGGTRVEHRDGYCIFTSVKKDLKYANKRRSAIDNKERQF